MLINREVVQDVTCTAQNAKLVTGDRVISIEAVGKIAKEVGRDTCAQYLGEVLSFCDVQLSSKTMYTCQKVHHSLPEIRGARIPWSEKFRNAMGLGLLETVF